MTTPALSLTPGTRLASTGCTTGVVVVRAPAGRQAGSARLRRGHADRQALRGRGRHRRVALHVIRRRRAACDGAPMALKPAKPLPASD